MQGVKSATTGQIPREMFEAVHESPQAAAIEHVRYETRRQFDEMRSESRFNVVG